jgi:hypothetical protein
VGAPEPPAFDYGGTKAPTDSGYTNIYSTNYAFAALKADGSIAAWGSYADGQSIFNQLLLVWRLPNLRNPTL